MTRVSVSEKGANVKIKTALKKKKKPKDSCDQSNICGEENWLMDVMERWLLGEI